MKLATTTAAAAAVAAFFVLAAIPAQAVEFDVGPGGVRVGPGYDRGDCRVIITHRTNRFGEDVTERRRVCD